jgi:2-amino-4-hydroxy-6-hydroxymethyldihydropteridine diphosphokinase
MHRCLISFGANLGDPRATVISAADLLQRLLPVGDHLELSPLYQTPPVGGPSGQNAFINAVAAIHTSLPALEVWRVIRQVEQELGRQRQHRWEARKIDLDILLFDDQKIWTPQLKIPHPRMCMRRFILIPALSVAEAWVDPVSGLSIAELAAQLQSGPGSLILVGRNSAERQRVLGAIDSAGVNRVAWGDIVAPGSLQLLDAAQRSQKRWVADCGLDAFRQIVAQFADLRELGAKLVVFWEKVNDQPAWEDQLQDFASALNLTSRVPQPCWPVSTLRGARYLLATHDTAWVSHELTAALEAMDCPVQPL